MTSIVAQLIDDNLTVLGQGRALVEGLDAAQFTENAPTLALSGVGPHLRHVVDFYERFLDAMEGPRASDGSDRVVQVDYDARERDPQVEVDPAHALRTVDHMLSRLRALQAEFRQLPAGSGQAGGGQAASGQAGNGRGAGAAGARLLVRSDGSPWVESNVSRELQSLVSHTVHHYALIAIAVRSQGGDPGAEFGVAPSTLRHWKLRALEAERGSAAGPAASGPASTGELSAPAPPAPSQRA